MTVQFVRLSIRPQTTYSWSTPFPDLPHHQKLELKPYQFQFVKLFTVAYSST